jgi:hypothetical protein
MAAIDPEHAALWPFSEPKQRNLQPRAEFSFKMMKLDVAASFPALQRGLRLEKQFFHFWNFAPYFRPD